MKNILLILLLVTTIVHSQHSGPEFYRSAVMNGNNIMTVFGNWGVIGQPVDTRPRGAWLAPSNGYIGDNSILIGLELPIKDHTNDGLQDTIHSVITSPVTRPALSLDRSADGIQYYTLMPVGAAASTSGNSVAMSNDPSTWPSSWGNVWRGLNGNGQIIADLESYYQMDDRNDHRFSSPENNAMGVRYRPVVSDTARKGHGIRVDVRYLQFKHPLFADVLFRVYDMTNESSYDYSKAVFGHLTGTLIGATGAELYNEAGDDVSFLYKKENVVVSGDYDNSVGMNPFWKGGVGKFGEAFLVSPQHGAVGGYHYFTPSNTIPLADDEQLWTRLSPGFYSVPASIVNDTTATAGEDGDYMFGTQYFSIPSGGAVRIISALIYDQTAQGIIQKTRLALLLSANGFSIPTLLSQTALPQFTTPQTLTGTAPLQWPTVNAGGTVDIYFSPDAGRNWLTVAEGTEDDGAYSWNTASVNDCAFGMFRIYFRDPSGAIVSFRQSPATITVDNLMNGTPFVRIVSEPIHTSPLTASSLPLKLLIGDPEQQTLTTVVSYSTGGAWVRWKEMVHPASKETSAIDIALSDLPNSSALRLRVTVSDGTTSMSDSTAPFAKNTQRSPVALSNIIAEPRRTNAVITIGVADKGATTNDEFIISFTDTALGRLKTMSVRNISTNTMVVQNAEIRDRSESPVFNGLRLTVADVPTELDSFYWSRGDSVKTEIIFKPSEIEYSPTEIYRGYPEPSDYMIIFGVPSVMTDLYPFIGEHTPVDTVNFSVRNRSTGQPVGFWMVRYFSWLYGFYFVEPVHGKERLTWTTFIESENDTQNVPINGDTLVLLTTKGLSYHDTLRISNVALSVPATLAAPAVFALDQNYPNPFNPVTNIRFSVGTRGPVTLAVYDLLGREVAVLAEGTMDAGSYSVPFDASRFASGLYLYRLRSGAYTSTKKMVLVR